MFSKINIYWIKIGISVYIIYHNLFFKYLNMVEGGTVLVHCSSGLQRSCTIIVLYLLKYHNMTPQMAISFIRKRRRIAFHGGEINYMKAIDLFYNTL